MRSSNVDEGLGAGVNDIELLQNGSAVIRNGQGALSINNHLVHAPRAKSGSYGLGDRLTGVDVTDHLLFALLIFSAILQKDNGRLLQEKQM